VMAVKEVETPRGVGLWDPKRISRVYMQARYGVLHDLLGESIREGPQASVLTAH
jgi:hypothetical protein